jgi:DNA-binding MarR family transcriptional regulator
LVRVIDTQLASDLVVHAARLVRAVRRELEMPAAVRILSLLDEVGPVGVSQLAVLDRSSQPSMSGAVAQLVSTGWVTKAPNPDDARASIVTLTDAGREELRRIRAGHGVRIAELLADSHTSEEVATAVAVLRDVLAASNTEKGIS